MKYKQLFNEAQDLISVLHLEIKMLKKYKSVFQETITSINKNDIIKTVHGLVRNDFIEISFLNREPRIYRVNTTFASDSTITGIKRIMPGGREVNQGSALVIHPITDEIFVTDNAKHRNKKAEVLSVRKV